jgi:hypothetical protein
MLSAAQENALHTWFTGQTGLVAAWQNQRSPELAYPYGKLGVIAGPIREGLTDSQVNTTDLTAPTGEEVTITSKGPRLYTVSVDAYASGDVGGANAQHYISLAEKGLEKPSVRLTLLKAGIAIVEVMPPTDLDETVNAEWVSRCKMDLRIRVNSTVTDTAGYIASVSISGNIGAQSVAFVVNEETFMSSYGELVLDTPAASTIATPGTYVAVAGTFSVSNVKDFELSGTNGLKYTGTESKLFQVSVAGSGEADTVSKAFLKLAVDGVVDDDSKQEVEFVATGEAENFALTAMVALALNEVLTIWVTANDALDFTATTLVITPIAA